MNKNKISNIWSHNYPKMIPKWPPKWSQNESKMNHFFLKMTLRELPESLGEPSRVPWVLCELSRSLPGPPRDRFWTLRERFYSLQEAILELPGSILEHLWTPGPFWCLREPFWIPWLAFWIHREHFGVSGHWFCDLIIVPVTHWNFMDLGISYRAIEFI